MFCLHFFCPFVCMSIYVYVYVSQLQLGGSFQHSHMPAALCSAFPDLVFSYPVNIADIHSLRRFKQPSPDMYAVGRSVYMLLFYYSLWNKRQGDSYWSGKLLETTSQQVMEYLQACSSTALPRSFYFLNSTNALITPYSVPP